jgi:uncharacterized cupredoxin-like copper-binding protein
VPRVAISFVCVLVIVAALVCGCGQSRQAVARAVTVEVGERDFHIVVQPHLIDAGAVHFRVHNAGPDDHEFILLRGTGALPMRRDGLTLDEEALRGRIVASLPPAGPGASRSITVQLRRGRYELVCNMAGHYMGGMHSVLSVR